MGVYLWHKVEIESYISVLDFRFHQVPNPRLKVIQQPLGREAEARY